MAAQKSRKILNSSGNTMLIIISVINMIATFAIGFLLYQKAQKEKLQASLDEFEEATQPDSGEKKDKKGEHEGGEGHHGTGDGKTTGTEYGRILNLDPFTINLSTIGPSSPRYLRVNISLELGTVETENEVNARLPLVRDAVIDLFNGKRPTDLLTSEQRDLVKEEIKNYINSKLINGKIKAIYFTNFAVSG
jgi:flagellar basal body-associated protein FliL